MNLLLVDDEAPALAKLRRFLADDADVHVVGEAADGSAALALVDAQPDAIDAVLLDIQMPGRSGLEVAAALPPHVLVAFVTAFDEYAVQAFELSAVDYLLKPFTRERLAACMTRLRSRLAPPERAQQRQRLTTALHALQPVADHWLVADRGEMRRVPLADVECVSAADNYIELHSGTATWLDRHHARRLPRTPRRAPLRARAPLVRRAAGAGARAGAAGQRRRAAAAGVGADDPAVAAVSRRVAGGVARLRVPYRRSWILRLRAG